jgi:hypothetical protein
LDQSDSGSGKSRYSGNFRRMRPPSPAPPFLLRAGPWCHCKKLESGWGVKNRAPTTDGKTLRAWLRGGPSPPQREPEKSRIPIWISIEEGAPMDDDRIDIFLKSVLTLVDLAAYIDQAPGGGSEGMPPADWYGGCPLWGVKRTRSPSVVAAANDQSGHCGLAANQPTFFTGGIFHEPSMIEGSFWLGQYRRIIRMNLPAGAGSQFDSLSAPGVSFWM